MLDTRLGTKRPGVNTSPKAICKRCGQSRYKRDFRLKSGRIVKICRECRTTKQIVDVPKRSKFERHRLAIYKFLKTDFIRRKTKGKEVKNMAKVTAEARNYANSLTALPDKIAAILGKTYAVRGDDCTMADDEALTRIRDLLVDIDEKIIERNKKKRLS